MRSVYRLLAATTLLSLLFTTSARAQAYVEDFEDGPAAAMLNGAITFGVDGFWQVDIVDGALRVVNATGADNLQYYRIHQVLIPGQPTPLVTSGAVVEVEVSVAGTGRSGAGVVMQFDPHTEDYVFFGVGGAGDYYLAIKENGRLRIVVADTHREIKTETSNVVRAIPSADAISFEVNDVEILSLPIDPRPGLIVGIAGFGLGTMTYDNVRITPQPAAIEP